MVKATILMVSGNSLIQDHFAEYLNSRYQMIPVATSEHCLSKLLATPPDLVLIDLADPVALNLCEVIKENFPRKPPVIFISDLETVEERLKCFDVGGDDYISRDIDKRELLAKLNAVLRFVENQENLSQQVAYASSTAMTAMTSMGEMGVLLDLLKSLHKSADYEDLAGKVLQGVAQYGLNGVVMLHPSEQIVVRSTHGDPSPMEVNAIRLVAGMGRIVEFKSRMSISYHSVTLLLDNMPVDDSERYGRLRDHLAILVEGVQSQVESLHRYMVIQQNSVVQHMVTQLGQALIDIDMTQRELLTNTNVAIQEMTDELEKAYISVALSDAQEEYMAGIVKSGAEKVLELVSNKHSTQEKLTEVIAELNNLAGRYISKVTHPLHMIANPIPCLAMN